MVTKWSSGIINSIAPGLATFDNADVPGIADEFPEASHWLQNYVLNVTFRARFGDRMHQAALSYLRRASNGVRSYNRARNLTLEYVQGYEPGRPRVNLYYDAVTAWEDVTLQCQMATDLYLFISGTKAFEPEDGSPEQRLYDLANAVKHFRGHLESKRFSPDDILPLWINPIGLHSPDLHRPAPSRNDTENVMPTGPLVRCSSTDTGGKRMCIGRDQYVKARVG